MSSTCLRARTHTYKALIVGLKGDQLDALQRLLEQYPVSVRTVSPEKLLQLRGVNGVIFMTRFLKHKHSTHARQIAKGGVVFIPRGGALTVAKAIVRSSH
jgi:hypothetical protein